MKLILKVVGVSFETGSLTEKAVSGVASAEGVLFYRFFEKGALFFVFIL